MENQHRQITGYRELTQDEIDAMNAIKSLAEQVHVLTEAIMAEPTSDKRWVSIAITDLQKGFMSLTRAIARPTTF